MAKNQAIKIGVLKEAELEEAGRIVRLAFGTSLGLSDPMDFMSGRDLMTPRWRSPNVKVLAARENGRLIGTNVITRWGSFGFFGPLTVLPEYWDRGIAQRLLEPTIAIFDKYGLRHSGLITIPQSVKHVGLYQKYGYWPGYLTAVMRWTPKADSSTGVKSDGTPVLLSTLTRRQREEAIEKCARLTNRIEKGLDLTGEIRAVLRQRTGDVVLVTKRRILDAFAVCMNGAGSEGGEKTCYVKFGAALGGAGAGERFDRLLDACETFALARGTELEAGVNMAREDAFLRMRSHGYRATMQGVAMQRPHTEGFNRADAYVIDDWR